jgi:hypothetical protein
MGDAKVLSQDTAKIAYKLTFKPIKNTFTIRDGVYDTIKKLKIMLSMGLIR